MSASVREDASNDAHRVIERAVKEQELDYALHDSDSGGLPGIVVALPGDRRLITNTILSVGMHGVRIMWTTTGSSAVRAGW